MKIEAKEKARPIAATMEQAEAGTVLADIHSRDYYTPETAAGQILISDFLSCGAENAIPLRHLKATTGLDGRELRRAIERERRAGIPILSDGGGYYLPSNHLELERFVRSMLRRAREIEITARAVRRCRLD